MVISNRNYTRWLIGVVMVIGLGTGIVSSSGVAPADTGTGASSPDTAATTTGPVNDTVSGRILQERVGVKRVIITLPVETITAKPPQPK